MGRKQLFKKKKKEGWGDKKLQSIKKKSQRPQKHREKRRIKSVLRCENKKKNLSENPSRDSISSSRIQMNPGNEQHAQGQGFYFNQI